jgi:hypothetical protein
MNNTGLVYQGRVDKCDGKSAEDNINPGQESNFCLIGPPVLGFDPSTPCS